MALAALDGYNLVVAKDFEHSLKLIEEYEIDLFVIGILFDDSKAMELIKVIRLDAQKQHVPIVVTRFMPSQYEEMLCHVMDTMKALGTVSYYFEADYQQSSVKKRLRKLVEAYLPAHKIVTSPREPRRA